MGIPKIDRTHLYKKNDILEVVANESGHAFKIGRKIRIRELLNEEGEHYYSASYLNNSEIWYVGNGEVKKIK